MRESATDPGFQIETHGPDDQLDASIMAITEALKPKRPNSVVHDFGPGELVIPAHQRHLGTFYGPTIPEYAIDKEVWAFCYSAHRLLSTSFFLSHLLEVIPGHGLGDATWFFLPIDLDGHFCDHLKALVVDLVDTR